MFDDNSNNPGIAVIGMAGRFPGAANVEQFWHNLREGVESISFFSEREILAATAFPERIREPNYVNARGVLKDVELFDAAFFHITPRDAELTDPQQRLFLECAWEALENAGYNSEKYDGVIGLYAGVCQNTYLMVNLLSNREAVDAASGFQIDIKNDKDHLTTHVSYKLNLRGPSVTVQTACSTSLVAIHQACNSLFSGECDMVLAGGVCIGVPQTVGYLYKEGGILSPDGHCRAFSAEAAGTVGGNGLGIVVLKRLEDAFADGDYIHAVIKGSAINNDGSAKVGYTAPSVTGQAQVIAMAQVLAGVSPDTITYIEAHGTGTNLGDPIEVTALTQAFRQGTDKKQFCAIGSVKSNVGHLDTAAGVAGFIKAVLSLEHQQIPPSLHFSRPNPEIDFANSPFYVNAKLADWKAGETPRRAGVSSFGIGGTNAHVVLEEAPARESSSNSRPRHLLALSAKTSSALDQAAVNLRDHLRQHPEVNLADVAYTLHLGRGEFEHRRFVVCRDVEDAVRALQSPEVRTNSPARQDRPVIFMFPGQGAQQVNMCKGLYEHEPAFRAHIDTCCELLQPKLGLDLRAVLYPPASQEETAAQQLKQTYLTQPALFVTEYALAQLWMEWGVRPQAMIGHSIGEYVAACLSGVLSLKDSLNLVAERGRLMQSVAEGAMLAVPLAESEVQHWLNKEISLATVNAPASCVLSGPLAAIVELEHKLAEQGIKSRRLATSHAFHSVMMEPILIPFAESFKGVTFGQPKIPFISNVTGTWIEPAVVASADYWVDHLRRTVRFADGIAELCKDQSRIFLESGSGRTLCGLVKQQLPEDRTSQPVFASVRPTPEAGGEVAHILETLGELWLAGARVDWAGLYRHEQRRRMPLPTYPFERKRHWLERSNNNSRVIDSQSAPAPLVQSSPPTQKIERDFMSSFETPHDRVVSTLKNVLAKMVGVTAEAVDLNATFPEMGADSLFLLEVSHVIRDKFGVKVPFRSMLEEYSTIDTLAAFIIAKMPPEETDTAPAVIPAQESPQPVTVDMPVPSVRTAPTMEIAAGPSPTSSITESAIERLLTQQIGLMSQQLQMLQAERQRPANGSHPIVTPANHSNGNKPGEEKKTAEKIPITPATTPHANGKSFVPASYTAHTSIKKDTNEGLTPRQRKHIDELITRLNKRTKGSKQIAQDYRHVLANNRATAGYTSMWKELVYPLATVSAAGGRITDVDGNEYVDLVMGFGALLFGHSPSFIVEALQEQATRGSQLGAESHLAGKVAALVSDLTGMERVAFCNSGTEAVMAAVRLARMVTGRSKIVLFEGCYHGSFDGVLVRPGTDSQKPVPMTPGTTINTAADVLLLKWDDPESLKIIEEHGRELAAVLLEPLPSRRPDLQPKAFLQELRRITSKFEITLIFDEVVTGFRLHPGGAQALYGVKADLVTYGKALGGGLPVSAIAGKAEYLDTIDGGNWNYGDASYPRSEMTLVTGTFFRNPLMMPVVLRILEQIKQGGVELYQNLEQRTARLAARLNTYFERDHVPIRMMQVQSMLRFVPHCDVKHMSLFYYHLLEHGVYVSETRSCFISTAHTDEDFDRIVEAVKRSVVAMRAAELLGSLTDSKEPNQSLRALPLTEAQKAIWALTQLGADASRAYHESSTMDVRGSFDVAAVRQALQELVRRHEALRITFGPEGDFQYVQPELTLDVPLIDFSHLDETSREAQTKDWLTNEVQRSFDLTRGPLIRAAIVKLEAQRHLLVLTIHHIVSDGWSNGILQNELAVLYTAAAQGSSANLPAPAQFSDYVLSQAAEGSEVFSHAESYWLEKYREPVPVLELPADKPRPAEQTFAGHRQTILIEADTYHELKQWSAQQDVTLFTTLLAAYNVLLHHLTKQNDLVVGIHAAGQLSVSGGDNLVGHCVNLLPLRSRICGNPTFASYVKAVKRMTNEAYEHQGYPLLRLIKKLNLRRDPSRMPLVAVVFNLDKMKADEVSSATPADERAGVTANPPSFLQWELSLNVVEANNKLLVGCDHKTDLFEIETVRRWLSYFEKIVRTVLAEPEISLLGLSNALDEQDREWQKATENLLDVARVQKFQRLKRQPVLQ